MMCDVCVLSSSQAAYHQATLTRTGFLVSHPTKVSADHAEHWLVSTCHHHLTLSLSRHSSGSPALTNEPAPRLSVTNKHQPTLDLGFSDSSLDDEEDGEEEVEKQSPMLSPRRLKSVPSGPVIEPPKKQPVQFNVSNNIRILYFLSINHTSHFLLLPAGV